MRISVSNRALRVDALTVRANLPHIKLVLLREIEVDGNKETDVVQSADGKNKFCYRQLFSAKPRIR